jgi:hypothetical protein
MISRRSLLQICGTTGIGSLPLLSALAATQPKLNNDPKLLLEAYQRLSGSLDDRLIIWWMSGTRYGVVNAKSVPLYGMEVGMFHRWYKQTDGSFKAAFFELTYYSDLQSGELLQEFSNPYTGIKNKVRHVRLGPEVRQLTADGLISPDNPLVHDYRNSLGPPVINGDNLWIPTSVEATIKFPKPTAPEILLNIYTTVHGRVSDALNENIASAPCSLEFHNVLKWEPWMQMTDHQGHMMSMASGRKLESLEDLPATYLTMANEVHAKYIDDPASRLSALARKNGLI